MRGFRVVLPVLALLASASAFAQDSAPKWGPYIDLEGKAGTKRNLGEADLFIPLSQDADTLLFSNLRTRLDDNDDAEGNFGLGVRHMLDSGWNLGGYGYFDRRKTTYDHYFSQVTLGLEALSLDWDLRGNLYLPQGRRTHQVDALNTASISGTSVIFRGGEEKALSGFDAEIGWRVPIFGPEAAQQLRLYGGGYRFTANDVPDIQGPRGRFELTFDSIPGLWEGSRLSISGEVEHDAPRGSQAFAGLRLRIPLQVFGKPSSELTPLERRMADPVVRDVDIVSQAGTFGAPETATASASGQAITVLSSASTSGANLQTALNTAGANSTVILSGSFNTGGAITTLQSGQTLMGAGSLTVRAPSGRTATLTTPSATLTGDVGAANYTVVMANNSTLTGMTINNTDATGNNAQGVRASGVSGARIINNTINVTQTGGGASTAHGIDVVSGASNVTVSGNSVTATSNGSLAIDIQVNGSSATVTGNTLSASGATTNNHTVLSTANILSGSSGNTVSAGSCSVTAAGSGSTVTFTNAAACGP
jgi:hypothetical protein